MEFILFFIIITIATTILSIVYTSKKDIYKNKNNSIKKQKFKAPINNDGYVKNLQRQQELIAKENMDIAKQYFQNIAKQEDEKIYEFKQEIENKRQKNEFKAYTADEKKDYAAKQKENKVKGSFYEAFVAEHYRSLGYEVIEHGKIHGKKDGGIDLIAKNLEEVIMIQCKNWRAGSKYTINHTMISAFVGNVTMFIAKNIEYEKYSIKRVYAISEEILDKSALAQISDNKEMVMYQYIPFK